MGDTLKLILFAEQLAVLAAQTIAHLKSVIDNSNQKPVSEILDDSDAKFKKIIADAKA